LTRHHLSLVLLAEWIEEEGGQRNLPEKTYMYKRPAPTNQPETTTTAMAQSVGCSPLVQIPLLG